MNISQLEQERDRLASQLAAKQAMQATESDLQRVEAQLATEERKRSQQRTQWLNRMSEQQQYRVKAEQDERELLAEINAVLLPMLERLNDARDRKDQAIANMIGIFEAEYRQHNYMRVGTAQHFHNTMREMGINPAQFPGWAIRKRLFGDFFKSEYQNPNVGALALGIDQAAASVKK